MYRGTKEKTFCESYEMDGITEGTATLSINAFDSNQQPAQIPSISVSSNNQYGSTSNANNYSLIINTKNRQKVKVCLKTAIAKLITREACYIDYLFFEKKTILNLHYFKTFLTISILTGLV
ncbi:hypothetical protein Glove_52g15 [Diversispora epigaea]|uniref:Uncharacterized protein n=1 Tax=Diversispora epigaea TaxID=1348612 RepID=A0A397JHL7_9GLOM|nr:hypothetical protein Glove_52g15 [Diversispora epigaea]